MHLVFVSSLVPVESPASGFDIANRAVFDGLRALGHRVSVVGYLQPGQRPAQGANRICSERGRSLTPGSARDEARCWRRRSQSTSLSCQDAGGSKTRIERCCRTPALRRHRPIRTLRRPCRKLRALPDDLRRAQCRGESPVKMPRRTPPDRAILLAREASTRAYERTDAAASRIWTSPRRRTGFGTRCAARFVLPR